MDRDAFSCLDEWRVKHSRKPLVIRGARQVGKSFLVRQFAEVRFDNLVEVNFENEETVAPYFAKPAVSSTVKLLEAHYAERIVPGRTLLFLDEIQASPEVLARLRYFREQLPDLHVVAAGSLLEFVLEEHDLSMPVGRIEYMHLGPMRFSEFLRAAGDHGLTGICGDYAPGDDFPTGIHERLTERLREFVAVGGMPEALDALLQGESSEPVDSVHQSILQTFADDFAKYGEKVNRQHLLTTFRALPRLIGQKLKYVSISREFRSAELARAIHMFELARVCYMVQHSASQGVPLAAMVNSKVFKPLFLDVGLVLSALGLNAADVANRDLMLVNSGAVCEQFVGQHLLHRHPLYRAPELHHWTREEPSANAEVDYVISVGPHVVPIEVKAGKTGTLRSLHQFMLDHNSPMAVRLNTDLPSLTHAKGRMPTGRAYSYPLLSLPLYMVEHVERLVRAVAD